MKEETLEEFLARGGIVTKCEAQEYKSSNNSRFTTIELRTGERFDDKSRLPDKMKKTGKFIWKDRIMFLKWSAKFK